MFRFTIRDLLWLMLVVGLSVSWWSNRRWAIQNADRAMNATKQIEVMKTQMQTQKERNAELSGDVQKLERRLILTESRQPQLDPSFPIYYPPAPLSRP